LGGLWFEASPNKKFTRPYLNGRKLGTVLHACHPSYGRKPKIGRITVQVGLGKKVRLLFGRVVLWFELRASSLLGLKQLKF
jgi:hypothetical protein